MEPRSGVVAGSGLPYLHEYILGAHFHDLNVCFSALVNPLSVGVNTKHSDLSHTFHLINAY